MVLKNKKYHFDSKTLQFKENAVTFRRKTRIFFRVFLFASLAAIVLAFVIEFTLGSPIEIFLSYKAKHYKNDFARINSEIDSIENKLHKEHYKEDQYYREMLGLDSLPVPVRNAGSGGAISTENLNDYPSIEIIKNTSSKLLSFKRQSTIQKKSYQDILKAAKIFTKKLKDIPAIQPINPKDLIQISSGFGHRTDPVYFVNRMHEGLDFAGSINTEIYATADGIVTLTEDSRRGYGKEIVISHEFGYTTKYAHLNAIKVTTGQKIKRGQLIGLMGSTGKSTGTHLHYEVRLNGQPINPLFYFADDLSGAEYNLITTDKQQDEN